MKTSSSKNKPTREEATGARRQQILDAALDCFLKQGVEATTIEQIRLASGASLGSIYHHFGSKEAIALAVYSEAIREYHASVLGRLREQTTAREGIRAAVAAHLEWVQANPDRSLYLTRIEMADQSGPIAERIAEILQKYFQAVYEWLRPFVERGEVIQAPAALYIPLLHGPASNFARHWLAHRLTLDMNPVIDLLADAAWNSLRATPESTKPRRKS
jgi:AcrR family transcriptional regulator